jgi:hypothetical protein
MYNYFLDQKLNKLKELNEKNQEKLKLDEIKHKSNIIFLF